MPQETPTASRRCRTRGRLALVALAVAVASAFAAPAAQGFGIQSFAARVDADAGGTPATQAASRPYLGSTSFTVQTSGAPDDTVSEIRVDTPPGLIANPQAVGTCTDAQIASPTSCPLDTQLGTEQLTVPLAPPPAPPVTLQLPLFNMVPHAGQAARFSFFVPVLNERVDVVGSVRDTTDYGQTFTISDVPASPPLLATTLTFWGVPADAQHDAQRGQICAPGVLGPPPGCIGGGVPSTATPTAFLTLPTGCVPPQTTVLTLHSHGGAVATATSTTPTGTSGCASVPFAPSISVAPDTPAAGAASGYRVGLHVPQDQNPAHLGTAHLRDAVVTMPRGVALNPSAARTLATCAGVGIGTGAPVTCPAASRIGTVAIDTPLLGVPLTGTIFFGGQGGHTVAGLATNQFRIFVIAQAPAFGVTLRLAGTVTADRATGQLTATVADNPQLPFTDLTLHFKGGSDAPLVNPATCGAFTATSALTPWSTSAAHPGVARPSSSLTIDRDCALAFKPTLATDNAIATARRFTLFTVGFKRTDRDQPFNVLNGSLPAGMLAILKSVPLCSTAQGAAGTCPASSAIGHVKVFAGPGPAPVVVDGRVFLTEAYRSGDVAGLSIVVPAKVGVFDLGTAVTRVFLKIRPQRLGIDFQSEPLPRVMDGVPLQIREIQVRVDRSRFLFNPTNCGHLGTYANAFSPGWAKAAMAAPFQVGGCDALAFAPRIRMTGGGPGNVQRFRHPRLRITLRQPWSQANMLQTNVVLPRPLNIDLKAPALKQSCPPDVYAQDKCSPIATIGTVRAITPALSEPLTGPAFLRQRKGELPDLILRLRNKRMAVDLVGTLDFLDDGRLITRVRHIPDAPISSVQITIEGGRNGSLLNRSNLCGKRRRAMVTFYGQNGKKHLVRPAIRLSGCPKHAPKKPRHRRTEPG